MNQTPPNSFAPRAVRIVGRCLLLAVVLAIAAPAVAATVEPGTSRLDLTHEVAYLVDPTGELDFDRVRTIDRSGGFRPYAGVGAANFGFNRGSTYWLRIRLDVPRPLGAQQYLLALRYPPLDEVVFLAPDGEGGFTRARAGDTVPVSERPVASRYPLFPVDLSTPGEHTFYLRIRTSSSLEFPLTLWEQSAFASTAADTGLAFGAYYGVMLAMMLYNFLVFLSIRDRLYLYYVFAAASTVVFVFCLNGYTSLYLWDSSPEWSNRLLATTLCLGVLLTTHFSRAFLSIGDHLPRVDRILGVAVLTMLGSCLLALVAPYGVGVRLGAALVLVAVPLVLYAGTVCWWRRVNQAGYFVLAWLVFLAGAVMHSLKAFGVLPATDITHYGMQIGSALQYILLAFALADRLRTFKEAKAQAQREANERLEWRVAERTRELDAAMEQLRDANRMLQEDALIDDLTGIHNRAYFDDCFEREWRRARRERHALGVMMIDVDHFKRINDDYGHPVGDAVLPAIAGALQSHMGRSSDVLARYGGEEFVALTTGCDREQVARLAERMRAAVAASIVDCGEVRVAVTVSIGFHVFVPAGGDEERADAIARADAALYTAKRRGRDRVVDADSPADVAPVLD